MANAFDRAGFVSVLGGMNGALDPSLLPDSQYAYGLNVSSREGLLHTRPRWQRIEHYIPSGQFQGAFVYRPRNYSYLALVVSGVLYLIDPVSRIRWRCNEFPTKDFRKAFFCQADRFLVVQNGVTSPSENWPIIMDGLSVLDNGAVQVPVATEEGGTVWTRLRDVAGYSAKRVPIGTYMAYGHGRLFVTVSRLWDNGLLSGSERWMRVGPETYFVAGDIIKADNADEVLAFTELDYLAEGGAFSLPTEVGRIKGMQFFRNAATGTGAGELVVLGERGVSAFAVGASRTQWKEISMAQVLFTGNGATSGRAIIPVNDDIMFRAEDGLRTIRYTAAISGAGSGSMSNLPQSMEVSNILAADDGYYRYMASMALSDQRVLLTAHGAKFTRITPNEDYFAGVVSLDTYVVGATGPSSTLMARSTPAYDGLWTGVDIMQLITAPTLAGERAIAVCDFEGRNELWQLTDSAVYDGGSDQPLCRVQTRAEAFGSPAEPKELKYIEMWVSDLVGSTTFSVYWRPDDYSLWTKTNAITVDACETGDRQQRWCLRFAVPADERCYDKATNRDTRRGFSFEFCLEWSGVATVSKVLAYANRQPGASPNMGCIVSACVPLVASDSTGETLDMLEYHVTPLAPLVDPGEVQSPLRPEGEAMLWRDDENVYYVPGDPWLPPPTIIYDDVVIPPIGPVDPPPGGPIDGPEPTDPTDPLPPWPGDISVYPGPDRRPPGSPRPDIEQTPDEATPPEPVEEEYITPIPVEPDAPWTSVAVQVDVVTPRGISTQVVRDEPVHVRLKALRVMRPSGGGAYVYEPWTTPPAGRHAVIYLREPGSTVQVLADGEGERFVRSGASEITWDANGEVLIAGHFTGGTSGVNTTELVGGYSGGSMHPQVAVISGTRAIAVAGLAFTVVVNEGNPVTRGVAFPVQLRAVRGDGTAWAAYTPSLAVALTLVSGDAGDELSPIAADATGWVGGYKSVTCQITGGSGHSTAFTITATDSGAAMSGVGAGVTAAAYLASFRVTAPANVVRGAAFSIGIEALDALGNVFSGYTPTSTVTLAVASADPADVLTPLVVPAEAFSGGMATVAAASISGGTGNDAATLSAYDTSEPSKTGSAGITISTGVLLRIHYSGSFPIPSGSTLVPTGISNTWSYTGLGWAYPAERIEAFCYYNVSSGWWIVGMTLAGTSNSTFRLSSGSTPPIGEYATVIHNGLSLSGVSISAG